MKKNSLIREDLHYSPDHDLWRIVKSSSFFKEDSRLQFAEKELLESYKLALDCLYEKMKDDPLEGMMRLQYGTNPYYEKAPKAFVKVLQFYSYTIPFLYICRHLLELSMKAYLERKTGKTFSGHFIKELWEKIQNEDELNTEKYEDLVKLCILLDDDGCHLRYSKDKKGNEYANKPLFIKYKEVYLAASDLYRQLITKSDLWDWQGRDRKCETRSNLQN